MPRPTTIEINLSALRNNAIVARSVAGGAKIMAAVKANAYGHGLIPCSQALEGVVDGLAVAICEEGITLREAGVTKPILILEGPFDTGDVQALYDHNLTPVVHASQQLELLEHAGAALPSQVWVKVDTGMHRLGYAPEEVPATIARLKKRGVSHVVATGHLADGEDPSAEVTDRQLLRWRSLAPQLEADAASFANSAGLINALTPECEWVRPGIMLYGAAHAPLAGDSTLEPVMTFQSQVMALRSIPSGESVGYGGRWVAARPSRIATVPVGYGDGYPRSARDGTPVWVGGEICPVAGRVSMDMITVDVTDCPGCEVGTPIELWGRHLPVNEVATAADTIGYELLTRMTDRTPRAWRT